MKIIVENNLIETKDIVSIVDMDINYHGFMIVLIDGGVIENIVVGQRRDNLMNPSQCDEINERYRVLKEKVIIEWEKDKTEMIILNL